MSDALPIQKRFKTYEEAEEYAELLKASEDSIGIIFSPVRPGESKRLDAGEYYVEAPTSMIRSWETLLVEYIDGVEYK